MTSRLQLGVTALRRAAVLAAVCAATIPTAVLGSAPAPALDTMGVEQQLFALINQDRANSGLSPLALNTTASYIARNAPHQVCGGVGSLRGRSQDMIDRNYFAHQVPPCGQYVWPILQTYGINFSSAGENIGWNTYALQGSAGQVNSQFMNSAPHRANILGSYNQVGIGTIAAAGGWSGSGGAVSSVIMFTEIFINGPLPPVAPPAPPPSANSSHGYDILTGSGAIYSFGNAGYAGNLIDHGYPGPAVGLSETPSNHGYAILTSGGAIYTFGDAQYFGNLIDHNYSGPAVALSYTPTGLGYSILTKSGALYTFGDAGYLGNLLDHRYPGPAVSFSYTPTGHGYNILTAAGALYSFGDATYAGNLLDHGYPGSAVSLGYSASGNGYNILTNAGTLYSFGDMPYFGNLVDHGYPGVAMSIATTR